MDLAGAIDLSQISLNFDGLPQLDLGQILSGLTLNVSEDGMQELASSLMEGYQGYASEHPEADYSHYRRISSPTSIPRKHRKSCGATSRPSLQTAAVFPLHRNRSRNSFSGSSKGIRHT